MSNRTRGVFERDKGSGVWWINYFAHGQRHREKVGPKSLAIAAYQRRKSDIRAGKFFPEQVRGGGAVLLSELVADALEYSSQNHSPAGHTNTVGILETLSSWFPGRCADTIFPQEISRRLAQLSDDGRKPATINHYRSTLSLVYTLAVRNGKLKSNPLQDVKKRIENNERTRFLQPQEEMALREILRDRCPEREPELDLALHTGMRRGEQYRLKWENIDLVRGIITIPVSKNGKLRHIPINSIARAALNELKRSTGHQDYVCPGRAGPRMKDGRRWFENAVLAAQIENFRYHDLRHTFATRLVMAGVYLRTVMELLGHKSISMTLRYAHLADSHLSQAIERIAKLPAQVIEITVASRERR